VSEEPILRIETTTTTTGVCYEPAIMPALIAQDLASGPRLEPNPDLAARQMSGGREPGPTLAGGLIGRLMPDREPEAGQ